jgi:hypothetical protein
MLRCFRFGNHCVVKTRLLLLLVLATVGVTAIAAAPPSAITTPANATPPVAAVPDSAQLRAAQVAANSAITVAWITSLLGLLGVAIGAVSATRQKRQAEIAEIGSQKSGKQQARELISRFGVKIGTASIRAEIQNNQGDALLTRTLRGFQILNDNITIGAIPFRLNAEAPQAKLLPQFSVNATSSGPTGGGAYPKDVRLGQVSLTDGDRAVSGMFEVTGTLSRFDPPLDLVLTLKVSAGYVMSTPAYAEGFPHEYHSWTPDLPTEALEIEIEFPELYRPQVFAGVFFGGTETMHNAELSRIQAGLERLPRGARLRIEEPVVGLSYLIYWKGP